jgi:hypothetical protein
MEFKRLTEFCDTADASTSANDIRIHLKKALKNIPQAFVEYEKLVVRLDAATWEIVKQKLSSRTIKHPIRGWSQFYDTFAEVSGYVFLLDDGCTNVQFIPEAQNRRTPDIEGVQPNGHPVLLESKNIGFSDDERKYILENTRRLGTKETLEVRDVTVGMPEPLKNKILTTVASAKQQLLAYLPGDTSVKRIVYLTLQLDIHMYLDPRNLAAVISFIRKIVREETEVTIEISTLSAV